MYKEDEGGSGLNRPFARILERKTYNEIPCGVAPSGGEESRSLLEVGTSFPYPSDPYDRKDKDYRH